MAAPCLLPSRLYCRYRNRTDSTRFALADFTAGGESHPALKTLYEFDYTITDKAAVVKRKILWYDQFTSGEPVWVVGVVADGTVCVGILKLRITPLAAVSVTSPPMTWFLLMSRVAYTGSVAPG